MKRKRLVAVLAAALAVAAIGAGTRSRNGLLLPSATTTAAERAIAAACTTSTPRT